MSTRMKIGAGPKDVRGVEMFKEMGTLPFTANQALGGAGEASANPGVATQMLNT